MAGGGSLSRAACLRLAAGLVLLAGLGLAALLYLRADTPSEGVGYVAEGGQVYEVRPEDSRSYQRGLEYYGGKTGVFMTELRGRVSDFLRGRLPALFVACAAVACAGWCLYRAEDDGQGPD